MKRFIMGCLSSLLVGSTLWAAAPWGGLGVEPQEASQTPGTPYYILHKLASGEPIRAKIQLEAWEKDKMLLYQENLKYAFLFWFSSTAKVIDEAKRQEEFAQVLARLAREPHIEFVNNEQEADLLVKVMYDMEKLQHECENHAAGGCVNWRGKHSILIIPEYETLRAELRKIDSSLDDEIVFTEWGRIWYHECGHLLGLADQYVESEPLFAVHPDYRSSSINESVMHGERFTCDDADGLINLMDAIFGIEPNRQQGWKSLCPFSSDVYVNGMVKGKSPYWIGTLDDDGEHEITLQVRENGKIIKKEKFLYDGDSALPLFEKVVDKQVLERDGLGRAVRALGPAGEIIYYNRTYDSVWRLITKNGKALRVENFGEEEEWRQDGELEKYKYVEWHSMLPGQKPVAFALAFQSDGTVKSTYQEGPNESPTLQLTIDMDKHGRFHVPSLTKKRTAVTGQKAGGQAILKKQVAQKVEEQQHSALVNQFKAWVLLQREQIKQTN